MMTRRRTTLTTAATAAVLLSACQGGPPGTPSVDGAAAAPGGASAEDVAALIEINGHRLDGVFPFEQDVTDYDSAVDDLEARDRAVRNLLRALPDPPLGVGSPEEVDRYAEMYDALDAWVASIADAMAELEDRRPELEPLLADGPPPEAFLTVVAGDLELATRFGDACAAFLDGAGLSADCYPFLVDGSGGLVTTHEVTVGDLAIAYDESGVSFVEPFDGALVSGGELTTLYLGQPPMVVDPASEPDRDGSPEVEQAIPWPSDPASWYRALPVEVLDEGELSLGDSGRMWSYAVVAGTSGPLFSLLRAGDVSIFATSQDEGFEVVLWWTTIEGQPVVAVSDGRPDLSYQEHFGIVADVLATLRVAD